MIKKQDHSCFFKLGIYGKEYLTEYEFTEATLYNQFLGEHFFAENDEKTIIGNYSSGKWITIDSIETIIMRPYADAAAFFIEKTKEGKYRLYNSCPELASDIHFDEILGHNSGSVSFKKDGKYYIFDTEGNLGYSGNEDIKGVFFGNYLKGEKGSYRLFDKEGNEIISEGYETIEPVCENVYIAKKSENTVIYNQGRIVASGFDVHTSFETTRSGYIKSSKSNGTQCIYDIEGNLIYESNKFSVYTNGIEIYASDHKNNRIGKVILKDSNPNVRNNILNKIIHIIALSLYFLAFYS